MAAWHLFLCVFCLVCAGVNARIVANGYRLKQDTLVSIGMALFFFSIAAASLNGFLAVHFWGAE